MADVSAVQVPLPQKKAVKAKVPAKSNHPKTTDMVLEAVGKLNEKGGSSLQAIKKYLAQVHKVDVGRNGTFILKAIKNLALNEKLTQTKGKGAKGSFKLAVKPKAEAHKKVKSPPTKKASPKKAAAKETAEPKAVKKSPAKKAAATTTKKVAAKKVKASAPTPVEVKKAPAKAAKKPDSAPKIKFPMTLKAKTSPTAASRQSAIRKLLQN